MTNMVEISFDPPDAIVADRVRVRMYELREHVGDQLNSGDGKWFFQFMMWSMTDAVRNRCGPSNHTSLSHAHNLPELLWWFDLMDMLATP